MIKNLLIATILFTPTLAFSVEVCRVTNDSFPTLDSVYKSGKFRVYYSTNATNADYIQDQTDVNNNQIPDYVENVAIQANATADAFTYMGYKHPLESDRYNGAVDFIDIHIKAIKGNGVAFESPSFASQNKAIKEGKCSLGIDINNNLGVFPGTWSVVAHELFHTYQYGYNQFKKTWYMEGTANWGERVIRGGANGAQGGDGLTLLPQKQLKPIPPATTVPSDYEQLSTIVYDNPNVEKLWSRLAILADTSNAQMNIPSTILSKTYVDGKTKVFKDDKLRAIAFMKQLLENLKNESDAMSAQYGRNPSSWSEVDQTNGGINSPAITKAIQKTMHQFGMNKTAEEKSFLSFYQ